MFRLSFLILGCLLVVACTYGPRTDLTPQQTIPSAFTIPTMSDPLLVQGQNLYNQWCAHCHGYQGEGQLASTVENTLRLGMKTVPAHDSSGQTWKHPDQLLVEVIKQGVQNPLNHYEMPGFEGTLSDNQIQAVLTYMRHWWTPIQRKHQADVTRRWTEANE
jgi:mono/diheme cytochrome c family protein